MNKDMVASIKVLQKEKETGELLAVYFEHNTDEWEEEAFAAIKEILLERGFDIENNSNEPPPSGAERLILGGVEILDPDHPFYNKHIFFYEDTRSETEFRYRLYTEEKPKSVEHEDPFDLFNRVIGNAEKGDMEGDLFEQLFGLERRDPSAAKGSRKICSTCGGRGHGHVVHWWGVQHQTCPDCEGEGWSA